MIVYCPNCNVLAKCEESGEFLVPGDPFPDKYSLLKCHGCQEPILTFQSGYPEYGEFGFSVPKILFPIKDYHINPAIPELLGKALFQAILCMKASAYTSSVIMCIRTLEGFAHTQGIKSRNLKSSLLELSNKGIINSQLYEWADELRLSGNEAAHSIKSDFSAADARDILDFTIAILDFTYSYKVKFDAFKHRKMKPG